MRADQGGRRPTGHPSSCSRRPSSRPTPTGSGGCPAWSDGRFTRRLYDEAVTVPGPVTDRLGEAAREASAYVAIGVNELDGGTLYNTLLYLAPDGSVVGRHRKLMPTGGERTVWGYGDGSTLDVVSTPFGVVGGLICWENYMPLARAAMYARGVDIYLAPTWDNSRYLGGDAASHRQRGPLLRRRRISRAARQRRTRQTCAATSTAGTTTG